MEHNADQATQLAERQTQLEDVAGQELDVRPEQRSKSTLAIEVPSTTDDRRSTVMRRLPGVHALLRAFLVLALVIPTLAVKAGHAQSPGDIWGVNRANQIFRWTGSSWAQIQGELKHVSIGSDDTVWGVNSKDEIYRWTGSSFQ